MDLAYLLSARSTCNRLQVGAVMTSPDFRVVYSIGYNGGASGLKNGCDTDTPGACGCLHGEDALAVNSQARRSEQKVIFVTHMPCIMCAKRLINLGNVIQVYYAEEYRSTASLELFKEAGIQITKMESKNVPLYRQDNLVNSNASTTSPYGACTTHYPDGCRCPDASRPVNSRSRAAR